MAAVPYADLRREWFWNREEVSAPWKWAHAEIAAGLGIPTVNIGSKGDNKHLRGGHRSQYWLLNSRYCTNRSYTVYPGLSAEFVHLLGATDITPPNKAQMLLISQRIDRAVRAGLLEELIEWFGNVDGDQRVDGWNNIQNRVASSDDSHLWHMHCTWNRWSLLSWDVARKFVNIVLGWPLGAPSGGTVKYGGHGMLLGALEGDNRIYVSKTGRARQHVPGEHGDMLAPLAAAGIPVIRYPSRADMDFFMGPEGPEPSASVQLEMTDAQADRMAAAVADALVQRADNPLGDADKPAIVDAVKQALREGVVGTQA